MSKKEKIFWLVVAVLVLTLGIAFMVAHSNSKQTTRAVLEAEATDKLEYSTENPTYSMENPKETIECKSEILDIMDMKPVNRPVVHNIDGHYNPKTGKLCKDSEYVVWVDFPDMLLAELENGRQNFEVDARYTFKVEAGDWFRAEVKIYSPDTGRLYRAECSLEAADGLCNKHCFEADPRIALSRDWEFEDGHFAFSFYTSALPDDGPKVTDDGSSSGYATVDVYIDGAQG